MVSKGCRVWIDFTFSVLVRVYIQIIIKSYVLHADYILIIKIEIVWSWQVQFWYTLYYWIWWWISFNFNYWKHWIFGNLMCIFFCRVFLRNFNKENQIKPLSFHVCVYVYHVWKIQVTNIWYLFTIVVWSIKIVK